jgi:hypothetical protein
VKRLPTRSSRSTITLSSIRLELYVGVKRRSPGLAGRLGGYRTESRLGCNHGIEAGFPRLAFTT